MKTKTLVIFLLISISMILSLKSSASHVHKYLNNTWDEEYFYLCGPLDSIIIYMPSTAVNSIYWNPPVGPNRVGVDSVIITTTTTGSWFFNSDEIYKNFYVYIISSVPYEPPSLINDTSFCTSTFSLPLDAVNHLPGGHASMYLWSTGDTTRTITVTTPGTYAVTITGACGVGVYSINVTQANPNAPHLGADQTFCWGSTTTLDPLSTNVASYSWSTGEITPTITVDTTGSYWIDLADNNGCSGRDTIHITTLVPTAQEECYVGFDIGTWKNDVNWSINLPGNADSVIVYKQMGITWTKIGSAPKTISHFLDMGSNPQTQSYSYEIAVKDTCGNESSLSTHHRTITLLSAYDQLSNTYGFNWSAYEGLPIVYYYLFGIDALNNVTKIDSTNWDVFMYNYASPNPGFIKYYIGFETPDCNAKSNVIIKSNWVIKDSLLTNVHEVGIIPFSVFPNPTSNQLNLNIGIEDFTVNIINIVGQVVLTEDNTKVLDVNNLTKGIYIVSVTAHGITTKKRFVKN